MPQFPSRMETKLSLLAALSQAYQDGFRFVYLSIPREGEYIKYFNGIRTCGSVLMDHAKYKALNHDRWAYSSKHAIIRSQNDSNAALMLFKTNDMKDYPFTSLEKVE